ncbi:hypothetical protein CAEBREN_09689 [Caenorhabditis brenneri]|uniref:Uncharacterized protein n=1 Tax=Caenorhabditis brenneri TaxID=135651 RepID=G0MCI5_CAEBE|nr:hypothetical protein CAEBREN_09689 [Caenorhabditis brenneri]
MNHAVHGIWTFGLLERDTNKVSMFQVAEKNAATLLPQIEANGVPGFVKFHKYPVRRQGLLENQLDENSTRDMHVKLVEKESDAFKEGLYMFDSIQWTTRQMKSIRRPLTYPEQDINSKHLIAINKKVLKGQEELQNQMGDIQLFQQGISRTITRMQQNLRETLTRLQRQAEPQGASPSEPQSSEHTGEEEDKIFVNSDPSKGNGDDEPNLTGITADGRR